MTRVALCLAAMLLGAACAGLKARQAREESLGAQLAAQRYQQPLDEVWLALLRLLDEQGYLLVGKDAEALGKSSNVVLNLFTPARESAVDELGVRVLETGWRADQTRCHVEGTSDARGAQVVITLLHEDLTEHGHDGRRSRAVELELALLKRLDAAAAARLEQGLSTQAN